MVSYQKRRERLINTEFDPAGDDIGGVQSETKLPGILVPAVMSD
jgi:hypothetical protein